MVKMRDRLTFGRSLSFLGQIAVTTVPLIYTSVLQSPPRFFVNIESTTLAFIAVLATITSFSLSFILLLKVGETTYSVRLHQPRFILGSTFLFFVLAILATYVGYLLMVFPYTKEVIPSQRNCMGGLVVVSLYVISLGGVNAITVGSRERKQMKDKLTGQFLNSTDALSNANLNDARKLAEKVVSSGWQIEESMRKEPMQDTEELCRSLQDWLTTFEDRTTSDQKRMVGWTPSGDSKRDDPWKSYFSTYTGIRQELSTLNLSSEDEVENDP